MWFLNKAMYIKVFTVSNNKIFRFVSEIFWFLWKRPTQRFSIFAVLVSVSVLLQHMSHSWTLCRFFSPVEIFWLFINSTSISCSCIKRGCLHLFCYKYFNSYYIRVQCTLNMFVYVWNALCLNFYDCALIILG